MSLCRAKKASQTKPSGISDKGPQPIDFFQSPSPNSTRRLSRFHAHALPDRNVERPGQILAARLEAAWGCLSRCSRAAVRRGNRAAISAQLAGASRQSVPTRRRQPLTCSVTERVWHEICIASLAAQLDRMNKWDSRAAIERMQPPLRRRRDRIHPRRDSAHEREAIS